MKYHVTYRYVPKGSERPQNMGDSAFFEFDANEAPMIPNVGDFVDLDISTKKEAGFGGKVMSRMFSIIRTPVNDSVGVYIVVKDTGDDWSILS